jgi:hypothetical protein
MLNKMSVLKQGYAHLASSSFLGKKKKKKRKEKEINHYHFDIFIIRVQNPDIKKAPT